MRQNTLTEYLDRIPCDKISGQIKLLGYGQRLNTLRQFTMRQNTLRGNTEANVGKSDIPLRALALVKKFICLMLRQITDRKKLVIFYRD